MPNSACGFLAQLLVDIQNRFKRTEQIDWSAIAQVPEEKLSCALGTGGNSVAVLVEHLRGNMLSRWTDFLHSDGEKAWRERDEEFKDPAQPLTHEALKCRWDEGWQCTFRALDALTADDLAKTVRIRGQAHSVADACLRQLAHYSYHVGQIVLLARHYVDADPRAQWSSLSIPRGASLEYNRRMGYDPSKPS